MRLVWACVLSLFVVFVASEDSLDPLTAAVTKLHATFGCSATLNGVNFDITPLSSSTVDYTAKDANPSNAYIYHLNPCGVVNVPNGNCITQMATFCQVLTSQSDLGTSSLPGATPPVWSLINGDPNQGVTVKYNNGDGCSDGTIKFGIVNFYCDKSSNGTGRGTVIGTVAESPKCTYTINVHTELICPGSASGPPKGGGLSGGWVFIIILLVSIVLYIGIGCVYQRKKKGASGTESCPNIEFWRSFPGLVKEGISFTWKKLRGLCKKGEYDEIK
jgi:hypothetical protein